MKQNLLAEEFISYFQTLIEQPESSYTYDQFLKLMNYVEFLTDCFMWTYKIKYLELFENFINYKVSGDRFVDQFLKLRTSTVHEFNQLIGNLETSFKPAMKLIIDERAFGFESILRDTYEDCDLFVSDEVLKSINENSRDFGEIDEIEFYNRIKAATLAIQKQILTE